MKIVTEVSRSLAGRDGVCSHFLEIDCTMSIRSFQNALHFDFGMPFPGLHPLGTHKDFHFQCFLKRKRLQ